MNKNTTIEYNKNSLKTIIQNLKGAVIVTDASGDILFLNSTAEKITGWKNKQATHKPLHQILLIYHKKTKQPIKLSIQSIVNKTTSTYFSHLLLTSKNNKEFHIDLNIIVYTTSKESKNLIFLFHDNTHEKKIQRHLQQRDKQYKEAERIAHIGHWELESLNATPVWSEEIFHIFGLNPKKDEISFFDHKKYIHTCDWELLNNVVTQAITKGTAFDIEFRIFRPDGSLRWLHAIGKAYKNNDKKIEKIFGTVQDITKEKQTQKKLSDQQSLLKIAEKTAKFGGWYVDLQKNKISWSDEVAKIHEMPQGYSPTFKKAISLYAPEYKKKITQVFAACQNKGISYDEQMQIITKKGNRVWVRTIGEAVKDNDGEIIAVQGAFQDITDQKLAEKGLAESEKRFQSMLSMMPDLISIHDADMNIVYSNWKGFGEVPEEKRVLNSKCYRTYRGQEAICPDCWAINVLQNKKSFQKIIKLSEDKWLELRVIPILGADDSVELFVEWIRDITNQKKAENLKLNFITQTSHEFINPLYILEGYASLLLNNMNGEMNKEQYIQIKQMYNKILILKNLINAIIREQPQTGEY
jgi:PAS domain S-box-containing protein